jgi:predicted acyltransferase
MSAAPSTLAGRLLSLDAYRGFIMLAMISGGLNTYTLAKDPDWSWLHNQLDHKKWEGCVFWDLIQPAFMMMVGVSMPFAFAKRQQEGQSWWRQFGHVLKRCGLLIAIGIVMDSFDNNIFYVQFIRVLQQIAIGYFVAFFVIHLRPGWQALAAFLLLAIHTAAYWYYGGSQAWAEAMKDDNVGRLIDRWMRAPFESIHDANILPLSRGFYVTFNAVSSAATIIFGVLVGGLLRGSLLPNRKALVLLIAGGAGILLGWVLTQDIPLTGPLPMVKRIWTASFAIYAAGFTCLMMLFFYLVIDILGYRSWSFPFVVVGVNSIFIYFASGVFKPMFTRLLSPFTFKQLEVTGPLGPWGPVVFASIMTFIYWLVCYALYRQKIFFKV